MRDGELVKLTPKAFETLLALVEQRGKTIEKDELLSKVWAGTVVEENNLNQSITALRKSLGDSREKSEYIATIPGVGYRFVAGGRLPEMSGRGQAKRPPLATVGASPKPTVGTRSASDVFAVRLDRFWFC